MNYIEKFIAIGTAISAIIFFIGLTLLCIKLYGIDAGIMTFAGIIFMTFLAITIMYVKVAE